MAGCGGRGLSVVSPTLASMPEQVTFLSIDPRDAKPEGFPDSGPFGGPEMTSLAQTVYQQVFELIENEEWSRNPTGELAVYWRMATGQAAARLINLALALNTLLSKVSVEDRQLLRPKIAALFQSKQMVFEENLVELEVGALLSSHFEVFGLEPLVSPEFHFSGDKPPSPDYGIEVPEGVALIDATVWHWEHLASWHRLQTELGERLFSGVDKRNVQRDILLHLPMKPASNAQEIIAGREMCGKIADSESGEEVLDVGASRPARIAWTSVGSPLSTGWNPANLPQFSEPPIDPALVVKRQSYEAVATRFADGYLHLTVELCLTEKDVQNGLHSLRTALKRKRRQASARPSLPYLIAVHLYSSVATWEEFKPMVEARLWPNAQYRWLSGILAYEPNQARLLPANARVPVLYPVPNPHADVPVPASLLAAAGGRRTLSRGRRDRGTN